MKTTILLLLTGCVLFSCATQQYARKPATPRYRHGDAAGAQLGYFSKDAFETGKDLKVIYDANVSMLVGNADSLNANLVRLAKKHNGYAVTLGNTSSTIRVNSDRLNMVLQELGGLGKVKSKTISGNDVTAEYTDYQMRLENAIKARDRYLELLAKAENVEATLKVEKELERLNVEIDSLKGKLGRLSHLVEFSTVQIAIDEKEKLGILGYATVGIAKSIKWLFVRG